MIPAKRTIIRKYPTLAKNPVLPTVATSSKSNTIIWANKMPTSLVTNRPVSSVHGPGSFHGSSFGHKYWKTLHVEYNTQEKKKHQHFHLIK